MNTGPHSSVLPTAVEPGLFDRIIKGEVHEIHILNGGDNMVDAIIGLLNAKVGPTGKVHMTIGDRTLVKIRLPTPLSSEQAKSVVRILRGWSFGYLTDKPFK